MLAGEIACLDQDRCSQFNQLLFRRGTARFCAFDLHLNGEDLRHQPLIQRKKALRRVVPYHAALMIYVDHVEGDGERLFALVCERDLEGIVGKHRQSRYVVEDGNPGWVKIRNRRYSQLVGRDDLFERRTRRRVRREIGWDDCDRAAAAGSYCPIINGS